MLFDEAKIYVKGGDGGDGAVAFRREKFVPFGGPNGGNGGAGGDIYLEVDPNLNTLLRFKRQVHFKADKGGRGSGKDQQGASGQDLVIPVPPGTVVYNADSGELVADLVDAGERVRVAAGGRGGRGNAAFRSPTNQAPRMAEHGEPGEERWLRLELKLIADVGVIGKPNAGKSTLLSVVSAARPKIADYPFTTLQPNLGVVAVDDVYQSFVMADVPGLIEGAAEGAGLGHQFLRHVDRTRLLVHLLDGASHDPLEDWEAINRELAHHSARLAAKPQIVVLNKMDLPDAQAWWSLVREAMEGRGIETHAISAATQEGVQQLVQRIYQVLQTLPEEEPAPDRPAILRPAESEDAFTIEREDDAWRVRGVRVERIAAMTPFVLPEAAARFQRQLRAMGVEDALREAGVETGDVVRIADRELEWGE
ncbi:MAG: GTPase ObgE [Anaerolineae bacterium]|nr:GTPase ObgE [Anaerolineae bacterium]